MKRWWQRGIGPFGVYLTLLVTLAVIVVATFMLWQRQPPFEARTSLTPFPPSQAEYYLLDEVAGHLHRPNTQRTMAWPEHELGEIVLRTNNLGLRRDPSTSPTKPPDTLRILITGDSHTDGVLFNSESVATRLEQKLNQYSLAPNHEVLNGGTGHYGPHNYLGFLKRHMSLDPDRVVIVIFTGNDLMDAIAGAWARGEIRIPERPRNYMDRLEKAQEISAAVVSQGFNQLAFFNAFPQLAETAIGITVDLLKQTQVLCAEHDIGLTVVLLPSKHDVEPETDADRFQAVARALDLQGDQLLANRQMTDELRRRLEQHGISVVNPETQMTATGEEMFWRRDHHLNVAGHAALATALFEGFSYEGKIDDGMMGILQ